MNKDRYCILIWKHYIQNLLFQSTPVVAIIQRIRTFGGNLHPNLCQPRVELFVLLGMMMAADVTGSPSWQPANLQVRSCLQSLVVRAGAKGFTLGRTPMVHSVCGVGGSTQVLLF